MSTIALTPAADELLAAEDFATSLKVSSATVRNFIARGELDAVKVGRQWRIPRSELDRLRAGAAPAPAAVIVTVTAGGPSGDHWAVAIGDSAFAGSGAESRTAAESALSEIPETGGTGTVSGSGSIWVPHRAAGRAAAIALAGLATVPGGDTVTFTVAAPEKNANPA